MAHVAVDSNSVSKLSQEEQIAELNSQVKCVIRPSPVHGVGVFAIRDILKGERVYCRPNLYRKWYKVAYSNFNKLFPEVREVIMGRWPSVINGSLFWSPVDDAAMILFMNHSEDSNYDNVTDTVSRDVKKGEELFENYKVMENWEKVWPFLKDLPVDKVSSGVFKRIMVKLKK